MAIQTSSGSTRERWVKALLPAAVIVMVYMVFIHLGTSKKLSNLERDLDNAKKSMVTEDQLFQLHNQVLAETKQRDQLQQQIDQLGSETLSRLAAFREQSPAERMVRVGQLCRDLSVGVLNQQTASHIKTSKTRENAIREMNQLLDSPVQYQQMDLVGKYANMVELMKRMPETIEGVVPIGIELLAQDAKDNELFLESGQRAWRVYLIL